MHREIQTALVALGRQRDERLAQLRARALRLQDAAQMAEFEQHAAETKLFERIATAIASPNFHVDVVGAVFLSSINPFRK